MSFRHGRFKLLAATLGLSMLAASGADFSIADFGARTDGTLCTRAIEGAMAACEKAGGGRVVVPKGRWLTGAIRFRSNCELFLAEDAEVLFSQKSADYLPAVHTSWEGIECWNYCPLVYAYCCTNVAITGTGTLRAYEGEWQKTAWYPWVWQKNGVGAARRQLYDWGATDCPVEQRQIWKMKNANTRPHFVQFNRCKGVRWDGFKVRNSPFWTLHLYLCDGVEVRGLDVCAHGNNNDGIDIEMSRNVLVENCTFDQGDDGVVIKSGRNRDAWRLHTPTENVLIRNCYVKNAHTVLGVGSEISGGVRNVRMENCRAETPHRVFYLKTNHRRGGFLENITCENVTCREASASVFEIDTDVLYEWAKFPDYKTEITRISDITARNISVGTAKDVVRLKGDARLPPRNIVAENLVVDKVTGKRQDVKNVEFERCFASQPDTRALLSDYVRRFNALDVEHYTNAICNADAEAFMLKNCPRFACPDKDIERTYYFRWWTYRKHLRHDAGVWTVSEFLPKVGWAGTGNTIVCPAGHHLREGRWLRDSVYASDLARFWLADTRADHRWNYSSWLYTGACLVSETTGDETLAVGLLDAAVAYYRRWEQGFMRVAWPKPDKAPMGGDGKGGFLSIDDREGTELSLGGNGYKPLFASAMWSEAKHIAAVARRAGRTALADEFERKAAVNHDSILANCWNEELGFFTTGGADGTKGVVRELHGYAPWYFGMTTDKAPDWTQLFDPHGFGARYGLTFPERRAKGFKIAYDGHACQWNGPSWPFATSIALTAYANDLHATGGGKSEDVRQEERMRFTALLRQYAAAHCRVRDPEREGDAALVPWIDENLNPDKSDWIARTMIMAKKNYGGARERGKDYNHSTFCDLVISGLVGVMPDGAKGIAVDPLFPSDWDYLALENLRYRGHDVAVCWQRGEGLSVYVDGKLHSRREGR